MNFASRQALAHSRNRNSITLHPKYGMNPTLGVCLFCHEPNEEIGLLGYNRGAKAPRHSILHAEPCDKCKANMALGITMVECSSTEPGIEINDNMFLTGNFVVVTEDWCNRSLKPDLLASVLKHRKAYVDPETFKMFQLPKEPT